MKHQDQRNDHEYNETNDDETDDEQQQQRQQQQYIEDLLVNVEELRQIMSVKCSKNDVSGTVNALLGQKPSVVRILLPELQQIVSYMDRIFHIADLISYHYKNDLSSQQTNNFGSMHVQQLVIQSAIDKALLLAKQVVQECFQYYTEESIFDINHHHDTTSFPPSDEQQEAEQQENDRQRHIGQACMARLVDVYIFLLLHPNRKVDHNRDDSLLKISDMIQIYSAYQKKILRLRCKPHITQCIQIRQEQQEQSLIIKHELGQQLHVPKGNYHPYHATILTNILGVAATLVHPLIQWQISVASSQCKDLSVSIQGLCVSTIQIIHEQTAAFVQTIYTWFSQNDRKYIFLLYLSDNAGNNLDASVMSTLNGDIYENKTDFNDIQQQHGNIDIYRQQYILHVHGFVIELSCIVKILQRYMKLIKASLNNVVSMSLSESQNQHQPIKNNNFSNVSTTTSETLHFNDDDSNNQIQFLNVEIFNCYVLAEKVYMRHMFQSFVREKQDDMPIRGTTDQPLASSKTQQPCGGIYYTDDDNDETNQSTNSNSLHQNVCHPINIVIGTDIYVSSCIEDIQYSCIQMIDRSIATQSYAIISRIISKILLELWHIPIQTDQQRQQQRRHGQNANTTSVSPSINTITTSNIELSNGIGIQNVYDILFYEIGCTKNDSLDNILSNDKNETKSQSPNKQNLQDVTFASALLNALDDDDDSDTNVGITTPQTIAQPPSSGSTHFLSSILLSAASTSTTKQKDDERTFNTIFCVWNTIHAASHACRYTFSDIITNILQDYNDDVVSEDMIEHNATPVKSSDLQPDIMMLHYAQGEITLYADRYHQLLVDNITESIYTWCYKTAVTINGSTSTNHLNNENCIYILQLFFENESYIIDNATTFHTLEQHDRLYDHLIVPIQQSKMLQQNIIHQCEGNVLETFIEQFSDIVVNMILKILWKNDEKFEIQASKSSLTNTNSIQQNIGGIALDEKSYRLKSSPSQPMPMVQYNGSTKQFTDWGALLISKQTRMLQQFVCTTMIQQTISEVHQGPSLPAPTMTPRAIQIWERLSQILTILQIEKPLDVLLYYHNNSNLSNTEIYNTLLLRKDFSKDAIDSVISKLQQH